MLNPYIHKGIAEFSSAGVSHVDYIREPNDRLFLDIQVSRA